MSLSSPGIKPEPDGVGPPAKLQRLPASGLHDGHYGPSRSPQLAMSERASRVFSTTRNGRNFIVRQAAIGRQSSGVEIVLCSARDDAAEPAAGHVSEPAAGARLPHRLR